MIRSGGPEVVECKDFLLDDVQASKLELERWAKAGGKSMVCMDPIGCGRNVAKTIELAQLMAGKVHLVATTGFQKGDFYDHKISFVATNSAEEVADWCALEVTEGMDYNSYNGPIVKRSTAKAGVIKAGTGYCNISDFDYKLLKIAALTQQKTGVPISVHTQMGSMGYEVASYLKDCGADLSHSLICHVHKTPDRFYHKKIMDTGARICYDGPARPKYVPDSVHVDNLKWLVEHGYQKQILLSMDAGKASYQSGYSEKMGKTNLGIAYLLTRFVPEMLEAGIPQDAVDDMLIHNPARVFSFIHKVSLYRAGHGYLRRKETNMPKPLLQIALDNTSLEDAIKSLEGGVDEAIDIIECGTLLICAEGARVVKSCAVCIPIRSWSRILKSPTRAPRWAV
jgi:phosphotriesterase-related protein